MGYPQSPPELRQELIAEQFVRGQSDPELKKYLWVVIRTQKTTVIQKQCLWWVTVPHGQTGDRQRRPGYPCYSRCLPWLAGWDTKCALSSDKRMPRDNNLEVDHLLIRTEVFVLNHGLAAITPGSGVSVVDSSDTYNHVAHSRMLPCRLNRLVGFSSRMAANRETGNSH